VGEEKKKKNIRVYRSAEPSAGYAFFFVTPGPIRSRVRPPGHHRACPGWVAIVIKPYGPATVCAGARTSRSPCSQSAALRPPPRRRSGGSVPRPRSRRSGAVVRWWTGRAPGQVVVRCEAGDQPQARQSPSRVCLGRSSRTIPVSSAAGRRRALASRSAASVRHPRTRRCAGHRRVGRPVEHQRACHDHGPGPMSRTRPVSMRRRPAAASPPLCRSPAPRPEARRASIRTGGRSCRRGHVGPAGDLVQRRRVKPAVGEALPCRGPLPSPVSLPRRTPSGRPAFTGAGSTVLSVRTHHSYCKV